jgi:hypothetical protein
VKTFVQFLDDVKARVSLAFIVVIFAMTGITLLGLAIIVVSNPATAERAQLVFNAVLPLFATWVGTVLAYYFAQENLKSATDSTVQLSEISSQERLKSVPVRDAMVPRYKMIACDDTTKKLLDALVDMKDKRYYPILNRDGTVLSLTYREDLLDFQSKAPNLLPNVPAIDWTVQLLLDQKAPNKYTRPFAVISPNATLAAAKLALDQVADSNVVFVTENGQASTVVVGMLTTKDIVSYTPRM